MVRSPSTPTFIFATGIENSYPTIGNDRKRVDEMAKCGHYDRWENDFELVEELGTTFLRYGPPIFSTWLGDGRYDWNFADQTFGDLRRRDITPIADLCHFGVPDWLGDFQNPDFPRLFATYARTFASRFPWIQFYTPVNEMYICALFSARYGWWNEGLTSDKSFVTALKHLVKANVLAMRAILDVRPDAIFVQSESSEYFHAKTPRAIGPAERMNEIRFLSLDLNYGKRVSSEMYELLLDSGMTRDEYHFFLDHQLKHHCIMGNDYYVTNEHIVSQDGSTAAAGEIFGYHVITSEYYARYGLPIMHTETNLKQGPNGDEAVRWLHKEWANVLRVRNDGMPILGFTWYSLTDQVDWDTALRESNGRVNPLGLYDLDRKVRPVGIAFKELISEWREVLPTHSKVLTLPAFSPSRQNDPLVLQMRSSAQNRNVADEAAKRAAPDSAASNGVSRGAATGASSANSTAHDAPSPEPAI
ncbi:MAG TPA: family 1 glycosylhydrolase [Gemmatimonadaceae bacterium]|nr:family 1 glycosylhydrolase [Gemmatimonadaceae bacterium]